jgi:hypothetical protein
MSTSTRNSRLPWNPSLSSCFTAITSLVSPRTPLYTRPNPPSPSRFLSLNPSVAAPSSLNVSALLGMFWLLLRRIPSAAHTFLQTSAFERESLGRARLLIFLRIREYSVGACAICWD